MPCKNEIKISNGEKKRQHQDEVKNGEEVKGRGDRRVVLGEGAEIVTRPTERCGEIEVGRG